MPQTVTAAGMDVGPRYLETLGVSLVAGRAITEDDVTGGRRVAVINRHLAEALWPKESPLGRLLMLWGELIEVIGVTIDGAFATMQGGNANYIFLPERQGGSSPGGRVLYVRFATNEAGVATAARAMIRETDSRIPVSAVRTMEEELGDG